MNKRRAKIKDNEKRSKIHQPVWFTYYIYVSMLFFNYESRFWLYGASQLFCKKRDRDNSEFLVAAKLGEMFSSREVTVKIASFIKIDIWFELKIGPLCM